jgi:FAD/FMN-containing dehydrogenase
MAGFTLAGGYGPLSPHYGLGLDNLLAAEVVLADGKMRDNQCCAESRIVLGAARRRRQFWRRDCYDHPYSPRLTSPGGKDHVQLV